MCLSLSHLSRPPVRLSNLPETGTNSRYDISCGDAMGCFSLHFLAACSPASSKVKIMTLDGQCLKFEAPIHVKEVLVDYPGHAIFHSHTARKLGRKARPLQPTLHLQPGQLYFLVPLPKRRECRLGASSSTKLYTTATVRDRQAGATSTGIATLSDNQTSCSGSHRRAGNASCPIAVSSSHSATLTDDDQTSCPGRHGCHGNAGNTSCPTAVSSKRRVTFAIQKEDAAVSKSCPSSLEALPHSSSATSSMATGFRLKVVLSKKQLAGILQDSGDAASVVESLLMPLLKDAKFNSSADTYRRLPSSSSVADGLFSWRPHLESIPEHV